ncbi:hypothetical protein OPV22_031812 [Ensete ventricosum]|uniref:Protein FAR1-RELATED SEQUENCE n=1 Tax=Ensete ventricosum TaxID=4639 RepID=A0AAV8P1K6_ENSVE|nr:hypothetical protein OPV22_031812 [Ensete ventricosum]
MRGPYKKRAHRLEQEVAAAKKDRDAVEVIEVESSTEKVAPAGEEHGQEVQSGWQSYKSSHVFGQNQFLQLVRQPHQWLERRMVMHEVKLSFSVAFIHACFLSEKFVTFEQMSHTMSVPDMASKKSEQLANKSVDYVGEEPKVGMVFSNEDKAYEFYIRYARTVGFSVRKAGHNHQLIAPLDIQMLWSQRLSAMFQTGVRQGASGTPASYKNCLRSKRMKNMQSDDAGALMEYLQKMKGDNPSFFYAVKVDEAEQLTNVFWADPKSIMDYHYFGDEEEELSKAMNQFFVPTQFSYRDLLYLLINLDLMVYKVSTELHNLIRNPQLLHTTTTIS